MGGTFLWDYTGGRKGGVLSKYGLCGESNQERTTGAFRTKKVSQYASHLGVGRGEKEATTTCVKKGKGG